MDNDNKQETDNSQKGKVIATDGIPYAICPYCGAKHRITGDEKFDEVFLGIRDVDLSEVGVQIFCTKCSKKFTIPKN